jgi:hypothetical protein
MPKMVIVRPAADQVEHARSSAMRSGIVQRQEDRRERHQHVLGATEDGRRRRSWGTGSSRYSAPVVLLVLMIEKPCFSPYSAMSSISLCIAL